MKYFKVLYLTNISISMIDIIEMYMELCKMNFISND